MLKENEISTSTPLNHQDKNGLVSELLQENSKNDLDKLETLIETGVVTEQDIIHQLIYDWSNHVNEDTDRILSKSPRNFYLQYEGLRDGDQIGAPNIERLSSRLDVAREIFIELPKYGVKTADLGMPISGNSEIKKILTMIEFIHENNLPILPAVAGRTHPDDIAAIIDVSRYSLKHFNKPILAYPFVGSSRIRMLAQDQNKWNLDTIGSWITESVQTLKSEPSIAGVIVPFEDTLGSYPQDLQTLFPTALDAGADGICICDTCSRVVSTQANRNLIRFIENTIAPKYPNTIWEIHTHNMLGQATSNAISAYQEGLISGIHVTLGGVGDLGGNTPLEEVVKSAKIDGLTNKTIDNKKLDELVEKVLSARNITINNNPFGSIYSEASRYVPTGVHASAFKKLEKVGPHLRNVLEHVYFPKSPSKLGLDIYLDIVTPVSGRANVEALAKRLNINTKISEEKVIAVLDVARSKQKPLTDTEFLKIINL